MTRSLARRDLQPELMDEPGLADDPHRQALAGLARVNRLSGVSRSLWRRIRRLRAAELTICDIASGGGEVSVGLWKRARRAGTALQITGYDVSPCAVAVAQRRADAAQADARYEVRDVLACDRDALGRFDVVTCSLFLHHLTDAQAVELLGRMSAMARRLVLVSDLERGALGYAVARAVVRVITRSAIVHFDGPQSVAAAFTVDEARRLAEQAGLTGAEIRRTWPFRYLLSWESAG